MKTGLPCGAGLPPGVVQDADAPGENHAHLAFQACSRISCQAFPLPSLRDSPKGGLPPLRAASRPSPRLPLFPVRRQLRRNRVRLHQPHRPMRIIRHQLRVLLRSQVKRPDYSRTIDIRIVMDPLTQQMPGSEPDENQLTPRRLREPAIEGAPAFRIAEVDEVPALVAFERTEKRVVTEKVKRRTRRRTAPRKIS